MDRVVRLYQLWSWLPHFRAVAETEHLPTASEALGISPSSLSRALKQLEGVLDRDLFHREGRNIRLNHDGKQLLSSVREAMRGIDDTVSDILSDSSPLPLRIAAPGPLHSAVVLEIGQRIAANYERVELELSSCSSEEMVTNLCKGAIDVCLHEGEIDHPDLESHALGSLGKFVACSAEHPLAGADSLNAAELIPYPFTAPPADSRGIRPDGWPANLPRTVGLTVTHMQTGIDACLSGRFLSVLSEPVIAANGLTKVELSDVELPSAELRATTRTSVRRRPPEIDELLVSLRTAFSGS